MKSSMKRTVRGYGNIEKYTPTYTYIFCMYKKITLANFARVILWVGLGKFVNLVNEPNRNHRCFFGWCTC